MSQTETLSTRFQSDESSYTGAGYYDVRYWTPDGIMSAFGYLSLERGIYWLKANGQIGDDGIFPTNMQIGVRFEFVPMWQLTASRKQAIA